ncbi:MAG: hypothetical protein ACRDMX_10925 [Solirubrobacteraceae bacterium]
MADFVDSTVKDIDSRLRELEGEVIKLKAARAALVGERRVGRPPGSRTGSRTGSVRRATARRATRASAAPRGRRRGGNTRASQALALVHSRPGITIPQIAAELKIEPNYLYRVMPGLTKDGQVRREGQGWHPAGEAA